MDNNPAVNQYLQSATDTATPAELTLMLYDGLVKYLMRARENILRHNLQNAHNNIIRSQDILQEFQITLDMKYPLSHNLMLLYDFMKCRLAEANAKKDPAIVAEVLGFAKELRDAWTIAMQKARIGAAG